MSKHKLEIIDWSPSTDVVVVSPRRARWSPTAWGLLGTLLLHTVIVQGVLLGTRAAQHQPPKPLNMETAPTQPGTTPSDNIVLLDLPPFSSADALIAQTVASLTPSTKLLQTTPLNLDTPPALAIPEESPPSTTNATGTIDSGDAAAQAAMFGRYTGQINARIERAWRRPRGAITSVASGSGSRATASNPPPAADLFDCEVEIRQDLQGGVKEVDLLRCNGSAAWQQSLVTAILSSSPLPAPPTPHVFTPALILRFTAFPYTPDRSADDYELRSTAVAHND